MKMEEREPWAEVRGSSALERPVAEQGKSLSMPLRRCCDIDPMGGVRETRELEFPGQRVRRACAAAAWLQIGVQWG